MKRIGQLIAAVAALGAAGAALAHEGHGLAGAHWHATDTMGYVALAVIVAAALWAGRRIK